MAQRLPEALPEEGQPDTIDRAACRNGIRGVPEPIGLVCEEYGGHPYEYYPLGKYIVAAPGVCGGRPTFKYTRIDVRHILREITLGEDPDVLVNAFGGRLSREAVDEAMRLASLNEPDVFERPFVPENPAA